MVGRDSRYANVPTYQVKNAKGVTVTVFSRRKALQPSKFSFASLTQSSRIDLLAFDNYGEAQKFWAIADASLINDPFELLQNPNVKLAVPSVSDVNNYIAGT